MFWRPHSVPARPRCAGAPDRSADLVKRQSKNWGLRAMLFGAVVAWQVFDLASGSVSAPDDAANWHYLVIGAALIGLVTSLLRVVVEE